MLFNPHFQHIFCSFCKKKYCFFHMWPPFSIMAWAQRRWGGGLCHGRHTLRHGSPWTLPIDPPLLPLCPSTPWLHFTPLFKLLLSMSSRSPPPGSRPPKKPWWSVVCPKNLCDVNAEVTLSLPCAFFRRNRLAKENPFVMEFHVGRNANGVCVEDRSSSRKPRPLLIANSCMDQTTSCAGR